MDFESGSVALSLSQAMTANSAAMLGNVFATMAWDKVRIYNTI